ncbi:ComF family protein [candidate division WOR-3 bacterium]|nr:ComF family protein [candidate division WOR-3 bacterium]
MICYNCLDYIPEAKPPLCRFCGRPINKGNPCRFCKKGTHIDYGRAFMLFIPPVDKIIHHFKYRKKTKLAIFLGRAMASIIKSDYFLKDADIIVPVPLFWWKNLRRGYNQAALLSKTISRECNIKINDIMKRIKNTKSQTKLNEEKRRKNVLNAFALKSNTIENKKIILIDDVMTTGATINECARVLKKAGAKKVYSCVAAITLG